MKLPKFPALCLLALLAMGICTGTAQTNGPVPQSGPRTATSNVARAANVRPNNPNPQYVPRGPVNVGQRPYNPLPGPMQNQPRTNFPQNYPPIARQLNPSVATTMPQQEEPARDTQPRTSILAKNELSEDRLPLAKAQPNVVTSAESNRRPQNENADKETARESRQTKEKAKWHDGKNHISFPDALRAHRHEWHNRDWWKQNCNTIVFVTGGYYFLDAGYWYPAWGYDPVNSYYDYDGPIYTYGNLLPDQVIANVQAALQNAGYYFGAITGSLSVETRAALVNYQRDQGLIVTGAIDEPTVQSLGL